MKRWLFFVAHLTLTGSVACAGPSEGPAGDPVEVDERDGIASDDFVDTLHYYVSTQEDAPGLYAYRPAEPDAPPVRIDPNIALTTPFAATFPIARTEGSSSLHLRPRGVLYDATSSFPPPVGEAEAVRTFLVTTDVAQLDGAPRQVSSRAYSGGAGGANAYATFGDSLEASAIWLALGNIRLDLDMTAEDAPLQLPEGGRFIGTLLGEGARTHDHWLHVDADGTLKFYDEDFSSSAAVLDEDSGAPLENLAVTGAYVTHLGLDHLLVVLVDAENTDNAGTLYRVTRPTGTSPGVARVLRNAAGESIEFGLPGTVIGRAIPGVPRRWADSEAFYFSEGASILNAGEPARLTRVTPDGWAALEIEGDQFQNYTPELLVRVDGGFLWAPGLQPELIYPDSDDPSAWERTPLPEAPQANESSVFSSAAEWVYYQTADDDAAVAFNVATREALAFANSRWIGGMFHSDLGEEIHPGLIARNEISAVLLHLGDNRLGAVDAAAPDEGVLILGQLPATAEHVDVNGPAIGPARLLRVEHADGGVEVIAVDTRERGSLRRLMERPAVKWSYETTLHSSTLEFDVRPDATTPLTMF